MQALWHELLLALVGHPGDCVQPVLRQDDVAGDDSADPSYTVVGLELVSEVPFVSGADRAAVNQLLRCGYHYTGLLHFTQSVDEGATLDAYAMPAASSLLTAARTAEDVRRLDAQQSRSVYSAASQMLSPPKLRRDAMERERTQEGSNDGKQMEAVRKDALVPVPMHPLLEDSKPKPKGPCMSAEQPNQAREDRCHLTSCMCLCCFFASFLSRRSVSPRLGHRFGRDSDRVPQSDPADRAGDVE